MAKKKNDDGDNTGFSKKWEKHLQSGFKEIADSLSTEDLKKKIVEYEQAISSVEKDMDADPKLSALKEKAKELKEDIKEVSEVYTVSINESQASIKYMVYALESRGGPVTPD
jgi:DNA-binding transcriptional regulator GbsR (MarR family)